MSKFKTGDLIKSTLTCNVYKIIELMSNDYVVRGDCLNFNFYFSKDYVDRNFFLIEKKINHPHTNIFK
jgi:hypothetical protein